MFRFPILLKQCCILSVATAALFSVSCSPIVAEYTYRGTVSGISGRQARELTLKEYQDGTVSGKLSIPSSSIMEPSSCGSIGGRIDGRRIEFQLTSLGQSYLSAKMASMSNAGTIVAYRGNISGNRHSISGKWHAANDQRSYLRGGSFSFYLTKKNGRSVHKNAKTGKSSTVSPVPENDGMPSFSVESAGNNNSPNIQQPVGFTVE